MQAAASPSDLKSTLGDVGRELTRGEDVRVLWERTSDGAARVVLVGAGAEHAEGDARWCARVATERGAAGATVIVSADPSATALSDVLRRARLAPSVHPAVALGLAVAVADALTHSAAAPVPAVREVTAEMLGLGPDGRVRLLVPVRVADGGVGVAACARLACELLRTPVQRRMREAVHAIRAARTDLPVAAAEVIGQALDVTPGFESPRPFVRALESAMQPDAPATAGRLGGWWAALAQAPVAASHDPAAALRALADPRTRRERIQSYQLLSELGSGGMSVVWEAEHLVLQRRVALKVLRPALRGAVDMTTRFLDEARALARLDHPNVVRVQDAGLTPEGDAFVAMELIHGETLAQRLDRVGALSPPECARVAIDMLAGLGAAHAAGILHRDVKPDNVMLDTSSRVVVTDFGVAMLRGDRLHAATMPGTVFGTPEFMAPEQAQGGGLDERADVYAVGAVLYQMATGLSPAGSSYEINDILRQKRAGPLRVAKGDPGFHPDLAKVVRRATQPDPAMRYPNALAMRRDLLRLATEAMTGELAARAIAPRRSSGRWWVWILAAVVVLGAIALGAWLGRASRAPRVGDFLAYGCDDVRV
ncbi:MAG: serine/threonine protein kinase [Deltaproteobacteria bacterium]|nr:serine/threonine protein kinase [Deltaproteobacteria bacterium]